MTYYSDLGKALLAMDQAPRGRKMKIRRRGPREATFHETYEQDGDTTYVDAQAKYLASDVEYEEAKVTMPSIDAHFRVQAIPLTQDEVSQKKDFSKTDPSDEADYFETLPDISQQLDPYNLDANLSLTNMKANVPVEVGNGAEVLMENLNKAADDAQVLMSEVQTQLAPIAATASAQAPNVIKAIQSKDLATAAVFSALAYMVVPSFIPGAKYAPLAIMAIWAAGQGKPKA